MRALVAAAGIVAAAAATASADPLRLRGDALATAQAPAGLLVLEAGDTSRPWLDAEAVVWTGASDDAEADALIVAVELKDPGKRGTLRLGRHVVIAGALRPTHVDGASARARLPFRFDLEAFGGLPVAPRLGPRPWDWVIGGRASRPIGTARVGLAWMQRRDHGALHTHELAADGTWQVRQIDLAAGGAWDLVSSGLAEARISAARRRRSVRVEVFGTHRSPAHLLPATSLFSVLGDVPARIAGVDVRWRAAPRLDVGGNAGARIADGEVGEDVALRTVLRLDDAGAGALGLELRRQGQVDGGWTGVRGFARVPVVGALAASAEVELAIPDESDGRGEAWPWALAALAWRPAEWELAAAIEASASPEYRRRVDALVRLTRRWGMP